MTDSKDGTQLLSPREIWIHLLLYPGHTLPTAAAPVIVAIGLALRDHVFAALPAILALLASWLIHVAGVLTDNHELLRRYPAVPEHPELLDAITQGSLTLRGIRLAILACLLGAACAGAYLIVLGGNVAFEIGIIGVVASLTYAGGPAPYARFGLAEPVFFAMFAFVAVPATYFIQAAALHGAPADPTAALNMLPPDIFMIGVPVGALVTNVLIIDDIRDRHFDASKGWRTATVRFGLRCARVRYIALSVLAYLMPLCMWAVQHRPWTLLPLLTVPLAWWIGRAVWTRDGTTALLVMTPRASLLSLLFAALQAVGLASSA